MNTQQTLKSSQLKAVQRLLTLPNNPTNSNWKVLIYDKPCRSIISPLLSVSQLRHQGVTLHLLLSSTREPIPDVPAIYFIQPTRANLSIIAQDCAKRLYQKIHIHFCTKLDRPLMEEFAKLIVEANALDVIASVHDEYLDFGCLENRLFTLGQENSYMNWNGRGATEQHIHTLVEEIAYGLLSVVGCMGNLPIIRCPKGGAPDMVARKLLKLLLDHPNASASTTTKIGFSRPLLVILDRNMDLISPIQHSSTYQALLDDLLDHKANRVEFIKMEKDGMGGRIKNIPKKIDLDPDEDVFYANHKFEPFPEAIENNGVELQQVSIKENAIRSKTSTTPGSSGDGSHAVHSHDGGQNAASDLAHAVDSLPALLEQKKQLEVHTSILQAVMNEVAARDVPLFFELESALATGQYKNDHAKAKNEVLKMVTDPSKGNVEDKIRLVIVYCLATTAPSADVTEVTTKMAEALETKGLSTSTSTKGSSSTSSGSDAHGLFTKEDRQKLENGMSAIEYLKNLRSMQMIPQMSVVLPDKSTTGGKNADLLSNFMARATNQATGLLQKATEKVSSMLGKIHKHHATRVLENLCEMKPNTEDDEYLYLDPKVKGDVDVKSLRHITRAPVREVITFVIGGGCYSEYQNLQMIANDKRTITYGSTELLSPCDFLQQLGKL